LHAVRRAAMARAGEDARHRRHAAARDLDPVRHRRDVRRGARHRDARRRVARQGLHPAPSGDARRDADLRGPRDARLRPPRPRRPRPVARDSRSRRHSRALRMTPPSIHHRRHRMRKTIRLLTLAVAAAAGAGFAPSALADLTIGVSISLTGPTSALGIPTKNGIALWPKEIAGEKLNVIVLDDATDPTKGVQNTRKFISEDHVDVVVGSVTTPVAIAMADVCAEGKTPQLMLSPANLPPGKGEWSFRMPQSTAVMAIPIVEHWKKIGVKTYGFLGYSDGYGEAWLTDIKPLAEKAGIKLVDTERFARSDTSVTGQALKLTAANPDAILVVASGSGAAMPHKAL